MYQMIWHHRGLLLNQKHRVLGEMSAQRYKSLYSHTEKRLLTLEKRYAIAPSLARGMYAENDVSRMYQGT